MPVEGLQPHVHHASAQLQVTVAYTICICSDYLHSASLRFWVFLTPFLDSGQECTVVWHKLLQTLSSEQAHRRLHRLL
jgi:hypothetical protein